MSSIVGQISPLYVVDTHALIWYLTNQRYHWFTDLLIYTVNLKQNRIFGLSTLRRTML
jgi:hypothetical protein